MGEVATLQALELGGESISSRGAKSRACCEIPRAVRGGGGGGGGRGGERQAAVMFTRAETP